MPNEVLAAVYIKFIQAVKKCNPSFFFEKKYFSLRVLN
jgi:hypothetical protein